MFLKKEKTTDEQVIENSHLDTLYTNDFTKGKYFQVVTQDDHGFEVQIAPRTMFKVVYIKEKDDISSFEMIKLIKGAKKDAEFEEKERVLLSQFSFAQLIAFLRLVSSLDLKGISERKIKLASNELENIDEETKKKLRTLLEKDDGKELIEELLSNGSLTSKDLVNTGYRKEQLKIFDKLLNQERFFSTYQVEESVKYHGDKKPKLTTSSKEEKVWQYFFEQNEWIFGYGLDYKFQAILQREFAASTSEADGSSTVFSDYLIGDKRFTSFIEIKKPTTKLFGNEINRSNSWRLSNDLIDSVSQILEQKASGQIKLENVQHDSEGNEIKQKSHDSKVILIIGSWKEVEDCTDKEKNIKEKTFELFRRDSRNIEMITYDELYERAQFIIEG
jgi:hypothetical protein